jgi:hypothetical protein
MNTKNTCKTLSANIVNLSLELKAATNLQVQLALINAIVSTSNALRVTLELNEGGDTEFFDSLANQGKITKYLGSVRIPTGSTSGVNLTNDTDGDTQSNGIISVECNHSANPTWKTKVVRRADSPKLTGNEWADLAEKAAPGKKSGFWK